MPTSSLVRNAAGWSFAGVVFYWFVYRPGQAERQQAARRAARERSDLVLIGGQDKHGKARARPSSPAETAPSTDSGGDE
ncbi:hypothetical protein CDCA_CDCA12G3510 [Cyanidium caldarium]|uniref:Uncharacterized protein n=1 Tax=Cyanidium caldarium TaxID=2771 RepID=A0AAV9IYS9_CYACA|nr:hypothetical protein CDCA_CDCA12G3510 [Cyanidium caldarium]|eukprot:ctg_1879.g562